MKLGVWILQHSEPLYFMLKSIYCVMTGKREYIHEHVYLEMNPDILKIYHLGEENKGRVVYSIREIGEGWGFFAEFNSLLEELLYADRLGFQPCVEYGEKYLYYEKDGVQGKKNAFEYYFEPIGDIGLTEASCNVVYNRACCREYIEKLYGLDRYVTPERLEEELAGMLRKYVFIKKPLVDTFEKQCQNMFPAGKVLGVHYRGTDYKVGYNLHPIQVRLEQTIENIKEALQQFSYEYIFLATDEKGIYEKLKEEFGGNVYWYDDVYRGETNESIAFSHSNREQHHYKLGLEVLRDVYTLSKCDGLIAGLSQVSRAAQLFKKSRNESYNFLKIIDNGINSNDISFSSKR